MATAQSSTEQQVRVSERDPQVVLHPADDDLFVQTGKQVIDACKLNISIEVWLRELDSLLDDVRQWFGQRATRVKACYCMARGSRIVLFFVPAIGRFDFDLAD